MSDEHGEKFHTGKYPSLMEHPGFLEFVCAGFGEGGGMGEEPTFCRKQKGFLPRSDSYFCQRAV